MLMIFLNNYGFEQLYKGALLTLSLPAVALLGRRSGVGPKLELVNQASACTVAVLSGKTWEIPRQTGVGNHDLGGSDNEEAVHVSASKTNLSEEKLIMKKAGIAATLVGVAMLAGSTASVGTDG